MICFDVSTLVKARPGASMSLNVDIGSYNLGDLEVDFLRGTIRVIRVQSGLLVQGTVETQSKLDCVRCLESFVFPVALELEETFRLPGVSPKPEMPYQVNGDGSIDLAPLIRELAWVAIPMKPLCRPDCRGLCPQCGANLNSESCECERLQVDPRWALLGDLL